MAAVVATFQRGVYCVPYGAERPVWHTRAALCLRPGRGLMARELPGGLVVNSCGSLALSSLVTAAVVLGADIKALPPVAIVISPALAQAHVRTRTMPGDLDEHSKHTFTTRATTCTALFFCFGTVAVPSGRDGNYRIRRSGHYPGKSVGPESRLVDFRPFNFLLR